MNRARGLIALTVTVLASLLTGACCAIGLGDCSYDLEIRSTGNVTSQLQSLYVLLSPKSEVQESLLAESKYEDLLDEKRMARYTALVQYQPVQAEVLTWKLVYQGNQSKFLSHEVDGEALLVSVNHKLVETAGSTEYVLVVLGFYGSEGFEQVTVSQTTLDAKLDQILDVGTAGLQLRDA